MKWIISNGCLNVTSPTHLGELIDDSVDENSCLFDDQIILAERTHFKLMFLQLSDTLFANQLLTTDGFPGILSNSKMDSTCEFAHNLLVSLLD